jgi:hypothetical protein
MPARKEEPSGSNSEAQQDKTVEKGKGKAAEATEESSEPKKDKDGKPIEDSKTDLPPGMEARPLHITRLGVKLI